MDKEEGTNKPKGDGRIPQGIPNSKELQGHQPSGPGDKPSTAPQSLVNSRSLGSERIRKEKVMERVYDVQRLHLAWHQVRTNAGAAGVDKMTVASFGERAQEYLSLIQEKLKAGHYRFQPARRVMIPKPGTSKERPLGIPTVMDRVVSQSMNLVLEEIFDRDFTPSNFGFRRGKSQHQAIEHVRRLVVEGHEWCASIDLADFFGEISHRLIFHLVRQQVKDERFITLIARALKAGVIIDGKFHKTDKGVPQGSPVSPILSNIALNELDQELERRGHRYCRWADDFVILLKSERAAKRAMEVITRFVETELGLPVNKDKSEVAKTTRVGFVGFQVYTGKIRISTKAKRRFKDRVRELTRRNNPLSMYQAIQDLNKYIRGWGNYYRRQEFASVFNKLDEFIRQRLRSMQLKKWKKPRKFQWAMRQAGYTAQQANRTWMAMNKWRSIKRPEVRYVMNLQWFRKLGLLFLDSLTERNLELVFSH